MPVDARMRARHAGVVDADRSPAGCGPAPPAGLGRRRRGSGRARPGGCLRARATGSTGRRTAVAAVSPKRRTPRAGARAPARRGRAAASGRGCESASVARAGRPVEHARGDQRLVVAGVVEQARGHVDGVAEAVARHLDDLAARQRHLQAQRRAGRARRAVLAAARHRCAPATSCISSAAAAPAAELSNTAIRPSPSVLTTWPPCGGDDARQQRDAVRDDGGGLGVAERLVQRRAAAQVGEQDGALQDLGHAERRCEHRREFIAARQAKGSACGGALVARSDVRGCRGRCAACPSGSGA